MIESAFRLPQPPARTERVRFGDVELETARIEAADLARLVDRLAPPPGDVASRARAIERAARRFADPADRLRRLAMEWLPPTTGFSREMIAETLPLVFAPITRDAIETLVSGASPVVRRLAIVAAGNVPGVAVAKTALALAAGVPCLVKTATGEPLLSILFARAIGEEDAALVDAHAALWWDGARADLAAALARGVESLVAYGSDATIEALARVAPSSFFGHGHRLSVAAVRLAPESVEDVACAAARDVALHDQQGCLSPQTIFAIETDPALLARFVDALAAALADLAVRLPRGEVGDGVRVAIRRLRDDAEWRAIAGEPVVLRHDAGGTAWTVIVDPRPASRANPLARTILVRPLAGAADLAPALEALRGRIESIGIAPADDPEIVAVARTLGVPRMAALGAMQEPDLSWRQGGCDPLAGIVVADHSSGRR